MCEELQAEAASFDGRISFVVHDFSDGTSCTRNPDETYVTASLYKLVVLAEAHRQQEEGLFSFDERILGLRASDAIRSMIQVSSNSTARALLGRLGLDAVAALPAQLGMNDTILRGEDYTTTAGDIAHFFLQLEARQLISPEADQAMLDLLLRQSIRDRIPALLPNNVPIAHKTGRLDRSAHDAGIIYAPGGTYLLVLLTEGSPSQNWNPGHEAIRQLAALSYTAYGELPAPTPTPLGYTRADCGAHAQRDGDTDAQRDANALASADSIPDSNALADADRIAHASADCDRDTLAECDRDALASGVGRWQRRHATPPPQPRVLLTPPRSRRPRPQRQQRRTTAAPLHRPLRRRSLRAGVSGSYRLACSRSPSCCRSSRWNCWSRSGGGRSRAPRRSAHSAAAC